VLQPAKQDASEGPGECRNQREQLVNHWGPFTAGGQGSDGAEAPRPSILPQAGQTARKGWSAATAMPSFG